MKAHIQLLIVLWLGFLTLLPSLTYRPGQVHAQGETPTVLVLTLVENRPFTQS